MRAFIQIDRLDLAQKELGTMQGIDDDATATQLATAWLDIALVPLTSSPIRILRGRGVVHDDDGDGDVVCCSLCSLMVSLQRELTQRCAVCFTGWREAGGGVLHPHRAHREVELDAALAQRPGLGSSQEARQARRAQERRKAPPPGHGEGTTTTTTRLLALGLLALHLPSSLTLHEYAQLPLPR